MRASRALLLLSFVLLPAFTKPSWSFTETTWSFTGAKLHFSGKAKGIGHVADTLVADAQVVLDGANGWELVYGITAHAGGGVWAVKDIFDKSLELTAQGAGEIDLDDFIEDQVETAAADAGVPVDLELDTLVVQKIRLTLKPNLKQQTARMKLVATVKATGLTDGAGVEDAPSTCRIKLTALSDEVPLADVLP